MAIPSFYDASKVGRLAVPAVSEAIAAGHQRRTRPAHQDTERNALLLIDMQVDFIHEDGALSVPGAIDDTRRTVEWLYENTERITTIVASLDSHLPLQIFSPAWWADEAGNNPQPFTVITSEDVQVERWSPLYEINWSRDYVSKLEEQARKQLMIWPYHTLTGTPGHSLVPALYEAIAYHTAARQSQPVLVEKGAIARTENYSIFEPEVKIDSLPNGGLNSALLDILAGYDHIFIAGQAKSHCVLETVTTMMRYFNDKPDIISRMHLFLDGMSSVAHPEIDFDSMASEVFFRFAERGLNLTKLISL